MAPSFSDAARSASRRFVPIAVVEQVLDQVGDRSERAMREHDAERIASAVNLFVRSLQGLSVRQSAELERELIVMLEAVPRGEKVLVADSAISLIALRNHVRYLSVCASLDWSDTMLVQSAMSELARIAREAGGGRFRMSLVGSRIVIKVDIARPFLSLDAFSAPLQGLAQDLSITSAGASTQVSFVVEADAAKRQQLPRGHA